MEDYDNGAVDGLAYPSDELFCNFLDGQASGSSAVQTDPPGFENFTPDFDGFFDFRLPSTVCNSVELKAYKWLRRFESVLLFFKIANFGKFS